MTIEAPNPMRPYDPVSILPLPFWALTADEREKSFKILRDERPVSWHPPIEGAIIPAISDPSRWDCTSLPIPRQHNALSNVFRPVVQ
jgi:hypothetical protein